MTEQITSATLNDFASRFRDRFKSEPRVFRAPGRVNLIGEHTDYNDGLVLPAAINYSCFVAAAPREDRRITIHSETMNETVSVDLRTRPNRRGDWSDYPIGVCVSLMDAGLELPGANMLITSEVPLGSGLSSSAALEVSVALALTASAPEPVNFSQLALLCQKAENDFVGSRCGVMDQFASCWGVLDRAVLLDCRSLQHKVIPIPAGISLVICNTMVRHAHAAGDYNRRRAECEESVTVLQTLLAKKVLALRDVSLAELNANRECLDPPLYKRARHVITEIERVERFAIALEQGNLQSARNLMAESHLSIRDDFEVSCSELDVMVEIASRQPGTFGSRMTGGGFGGCTINLVGNTKVSEFGRRVASDYLAATGITPQIYVCRASEGATEVTTASSADAE